MPIVTVCSPTQRRFKRYGLEEDGKQKVLDLHQNAGHYSKLGDFYACTPKSFAPHHGVGGWMKMKMSSALTISVSSGSMARRTSRRSCPSSSTSPSTSALWLSPFSGLVVTLYANQRDTARRFFVELTGTHILVALAVVREGVATEKTFLLVLGRPRIYRLEQGNMLLGRGCRGDRDLLDDGDR